MARTKLGLFFVKTLNGAPPAMQEVLPTGGTTIYEGAPLRLSATYGKVGNLAITATAMYGVAAHKLTAAQVTAATPLLCYLADGNNVFEGKQASTSSIAPRAYLGDLLDIGGTAGDNVRLTTAASTKMLRVVGWNPIKTDSSGNQTAVAPATAATGTYYWVTSAKNIVDSSTREPRA